jgi:hypothetical protein
MTTTVRHSGNLEDFVPNEEVLGLVMLNAGDVMCFSLHKEVLDLVSASFID